MACDLYQQEERIWQALYKDHASVVCIHHLRGYILYGHIGISRRHIQGMVFQEEADSIG